MKNGNEKIVFKKRVNVWAAELDIKVNKISIRSMKNKWASYTIKSGMLIFNSRLLSIEDQLQDYVIVHELLHANVPNHGKLWKSLMSAHLGNYTSLENKLKEYAIGLRE
jgi:predicted metal-dependent hydrolase